MTRLSAALRLASLSSFLVLAACGGTSTDPSVLHVADRVIVTDGCPDGSDLVVTFEDADGETVVHGRCLAKLRQHVPEDPSHDVPAPMRPQEPDGPAPERLPATDR